MSSEFEQPAAYIRKSTDDQEDQHQIDDIKSFLESNDLKVGDVDWYEEGAASGASKDRNEFRRLIKNVKNGEVTDVIIWEIPRIARNALQAQEFFEACEVNEVPIHVTTGAIRRIDSDGTGRLVADIIAAVAAEERRTLIRRTKAGQKRARKEGKWLGNVPTGFIRSDGGYLKPNLDPDYDNGETGFFDVVEALEMIENGKSYNKTADDTPNVTRHTLSTIHQEKKDWYLSGEADDPRVEEAVKAANIENELHYG